MSTIIAGRAYTPSMLRLVHHGVFPLALFAVAMPLCAQRGAGGMASGARGQSAAAHGPAVSGISGARGPVGPAYGAGSSALRSPYAAGQRSLFPPPGITSTQPVYYANGVRRYGPPGGAGSRNRAGYGGVGYGLLGYGNSGYGYPGYGFGDGSLDYADSDAFDPLDPNNTVNGPYAQTAQDAFVYGQPQGQAGPPPDAPGNEAPNAGSYPQAAYAQPAGEAPIPYAAYAQPRAPRAGAQPAAPPRPAAPAPEEDAVTIVFKDGRPAEQIHNYALTRTTLYITTDRVRAVPVEDIDLPATVKANEKAGVDFQLPTK